jgi:hypothetical protein
MLGYSIAFVQLIQTSEKIQKIAIEQTFKAKTGVFVSSLVAFGWAIACLLSVTKAGDKVIKTRIIGYSGNGNQGLFSGHHISLAVKECLQQGYIKQEQVEVGDSTIFFLIAMVAVLMEIREPCILSNGFFNFTTLPQNWQKINHIKMKYKDLSEADKSLLINHIRSFDEAEDQWSALGRDSKLLRLYCEIGELAEPLIRGCEWGNIIQEGMDLSRS